MSVIMPVGALLAAVLVLIPLHSHWKARNVPTISMIIWLCLVNITRAVNAIVWRDNLDLKLLVWCDIGKQSSVYPMTPISS
ncbi:hypothetical protein PHLCEN_2v3339 [Hermanssonia centrifuga]|uniref:Uncharacterized protein n=1 Tax=Hermanssonia centrifuga TaxID=98765 RepID=A0A2R6QMA7_9APHY|nr:hypothetical protein PHLCEN_2v3339 [Hermanssonia centrifuga]